ncbi:general negative regulator of transcription subunit 4-like [Phoenix dactylifera]|uniref:General negative regulator of transcription subunit 4-like n=1 Tax=Phoenix dactylifera TaxID=42345 RepID=A0A8B9AH39_PHODC|nr:general negative regulator of transcription subunit 4-like [Phoenix dactylifera]XP_038985113.1 general negative regulator of transcription subunit 4-like [Phoenix dactylifera]
MSNQGEIHCPLCMEEMDLTDQLLKPCKCGYEMCIWCWHHIIEMAEKDDTEGRCPACRSPYDKERILGRKISSERLAELNSEKKQKLQKAKLKTSEVRSDLTTVRVIKRNLVYVAGLPAKIADEETLRKKEFLGQYGKITKIVIARDVGTNRLFPSFCTSVVYVTFSKEQEALRCIEVVNGFILDGRPLKACFGTTRYCHAWLKNMPCRNPHCFFLHDAGPQEDICNKDEVASACLSKLPQNSGNALHNFERRSGSVLPPPRDHFCRSNSSVARDKFLIRSVVYTPTDNGKRHFQNGDSGKSDVLPVAASWGSRLASGRSPYAGVAFSQGTIDHPIVPTSSLAGVDIQALPQNAYPTQRQMIMLRNQMPLSNGHLKNIASSEPYVENGFREDTVMPNFKSSNYTNIMTNNTVSGSSFVTCREDMESRITQPSHSSDSVGFSQQPYASFFR